MIEMSLGDFVLPIIRSMDTYNYLLKSHHRRVTMIAFAIGKQMNLNHKQLANLVIAAALHDVGALSVQDRDQLLEADVSDPKPHCQMGFEILSAFEYFKDIAQIVKHHHIFYHELFAYSEDVRIQSHIIHVADRVEIFIDRNTPILQQKERILREINDRKGTLLHPRVCVAFEQAARSSQFWIDIKNRTLDEVFDDIDFGDNIMITEEMIQGFSMVMARIVDFRCQFTAAHSLTVGNLAHYIGEMLLKEEDYHAQLLVAGLLHDVGKFGVNPSLLTKEGELANNEYLELQKIPEFNEKLLQDLMDSPWFENVIHWVTSIGDKHEASSKDTLDPENLGTSIIELSHIITALMEGRPYREAYDMKTALHILQKEITSKAEEEIYSFIVDHKDEISRIIVQYHNEGMEFYNNIQRDFEYW